MGKLGLTTREFYSFVSHNWKAFAIIGTLFLGVVIWLFSRDGYKPDESNGDITIVDSNGKVIMTVPDHTGKNEE